MLTACSTENDFSQEDTSFKEVELAIDEYTNQFLNSHPSSTRGDHGWSKFKDAVRADHLGYHNGSTVLSIGLVKKKMERTQK